MIVITEKPAAARWIDEVLRRVLPHILSSPAPISANRGDGVSGASDAPEEPILYLFANGLGVPFGYDYPRDLRWSEYPVWRPAAYRITPAGDTHSNLRQLALMSPVRLGAQREQGAQSSLPAAFASLAGLSMSRQENGRIWFNDYGDLPPGQDVLSVCAGGASECLSQRLLVDHLRNTGKMGRWLGVRMLNAWDPQSAEKALCANADVAAEHMRQFDAWCAAAQLKHDFNFSFLINSSGVLTRSYHAAGGAVAQPVISKFGVQMLYALRHRGLVQSGQLLNDLWNWRGTGRYAKGAVRLGSPTSTAALLTGLCELGLAAQHDEQMSITDVGEQFLNRLHPGCEDPDLPFRLEQWMLDPQGGREAAGRYMRTWFGRQMRFMDRQSSAARSRPAAPDGAAAAQDTPRDRGMRGTMG